MSDSSIIDLRPSPPPAPSSTTGRDVIPRELPLTNLERFMLTCDGPDHPMVFRVLMRFEGLVDRDKLSEAFTLAAARHPLLSSTLIDGPLPRWSSTERRPTLEWRDGTTCLDVGQIEPIDITERAGLRVCVWRSDDAIEVLLDFHHACCDGQGARQLIADWFSSYDRLVHGGQPDFIQLNESQLDLRGELRERADRKPVGFLEGLRNTLVTVRGKTARVSQLSRTDGDDASVTDRTSHVVERPFSIEETAVLRGRLKERGVSINDLGLAVCMASFHEVVPTAKSQSRVTVMNPTDLRLPSDRRLSAANRVGFAIIRRRLSDCTDFSALLTSLHDEMSYVKERYVGAEFVRGLAVMDSWPRVFRWLRRSELYTPSLQFTCLGDTTRGKRYGFRIEDDVVTVGHLKLDRICGFAPHGPRVPLSVTACETNNRLSMTVRGAAAYVEESQCVAYADSLVGRMKEWAGL